jgi:hypothetical protein
LSTTPVSPGSSISDIRHNRPHVCELVRPWTHKPPLRWQRVRIPPASGVEGSWRGQALRHERGDPGTACSVSILMIIWRVRPVGLSWHGG